MKTAVDQAREAIANDDPKALKRLLRAYPELLRWRDTETCDVLLMATTSYANFPGVEHEEHWNRRRCAEVLLDEGAEWDERVLARVIETGAVKMLEMLVKRGVVQLTLRVSAARGRLSDVRGVVDDEGGVSNVSDALLVACRLGHREVAAFLLERCCVLDGDLAQRITAGPGTSDFLKQLLASAPDTARFASHSNDLTPGVVWRVAVEQQLLAALSSQDVEHVQRLIAEEPFLMDPSSRALQVRFLETASYSSRARPILKAFLDAAAAVASGDPPPSCATSYALEYGNAEYLSDLARVWPVPKDLPHAAGRGDERGVLRWFADDGSPALGNPRDHCPFPDHEREPTVQSVLDRSLAWAVRNDEYAVADLLLSRGADINTRWSTHEPASILHECAHAGALEQVRFLVDRGIDVTIRDSRFDATAAGWATFAEHADIASFLESQGGL